MKKQEQYNTEEKENQAWELLEQLEGYIREDEALLACCNIYRNDDLGMDKYMTMLQNKRNKVSIQIEKLRTKIYTLILKESK